MNAYEKFEKLDDKEFKLITGVTREVFAEMVEVLRRKHKEEHARGGVAGMPVELRLALSLEYWREYRGFRHDLCKHAHELHMNYRSYLFMWRTTTKSVRAR